MNTPKVTVFIPVYNRERYIGPALDSVLAQTFGDFEVLVLDDGSTDGTLARLAEYRDPRLRIECNPANLGIPATRNRGLELARGEYIALLDSDDLCYPDRLARQVAFLDRHADIAQVGSACNFMDAQGRPLKRVRRQPLAADEVAASLPFHCAMTNRTIMARTAILREFGYRAVFPCSEDYDLHQRLSRSRRMANLADILVCGREHDGRITRNAQQLLRECKIAICRRALAELGVEADDGELARHYALTRLKQLGERFDADYMDWAEQWLLRLEAANRHSGRFARDAFGRVVVERWLELCWRARRRRDLQPLRRAWRSPLTRRIEPSALFRKYWQQWQLPGRHPLPA